VVRLPGFEPGLEAWKTLRNTFTTPNEILQTFEEFCQVDLNLKSSTIRIHHGVIRRLLTKYSKPLQHISRQDIRAYLKDYLPKSISTYANQVKALRIFFRDFLQAGYLVETFKLPQRGYVPKIIPSKRDLQQFYHALHHPRDKALFLLLATSGLRRNEALTLTQDDIVLNQHMVNPSKHRNTISTKNSWVSFFNAEAHDALQHWLDHHMTTTHTIFS
jgi:integrase